MSRTDNIYTMVDAGLLDIEKAANNKYWPLFGS